MKTLPLYAVVLVWIGCLHQVFGFREPDRSVLPNFDLRLVAQPQALDAQRQTAADQLRARIPSVKIDLDGVLAAPKYIRNTDGFLSGHDFLDAPSLPGLAGQNAFPLLVVQAAQADPHRAIKRFLDENVNLLGHDAQILQPARLTREFVDPTTGMRTVVWEQQLDGIAVFGAVLIGHIAKDGELVCLSSQFVPRLEDASKLDVVTRFRLANNPPLTPQGAVVAAAAAIGEQLEAEMVIAVDPSPQGAERRQEFTAEPVLNGARAELVWLPMDRINMRLCWRVNLASRSRGEAFQVVIDAQTGEVFIRQCRTFYLSDATYLVFTSDSPTPKSPGWSSPNTNQPALTNRILVVTNAVSTNASPNGWINDGTNTTIGNNVDAHLDWTNANPGYALQLPPGYPSRPVGSPFRVFTNALDLSTDPTNSADAMVVQLFYWCNWMHDKLYDLGFTEPAGNFQWTNFNRGGTQRDPVLADAQDNRFDTPTNYNNANFTSNPDGTPGRMQMYIWNGPIPDRDGDLDAEVILHEYTHGLSDRRVGGGNGGAGLSTVGQPLGLGEGWSDFYALALLSESSDDINGSYPIGGYVTYLLQYGPTNAPQSLTENYYYGIRRYPYSTDMTKNPLTFKDIDSHQAQAHPEAPLSPLFSPWSPTTATNAPHRLGEVWCVALWEARAKFIGKMGHANGNTNILKLVMDGMNLAPPDPTFLQARDGILLADRVKNGGTNLTELWQAFAKRGMGYGATSPEFLTTIGVVEAYDTPPQVTNVWAWTFQTSGSITSSPAIGGDGTIYVGSSDGKVYAINPNGTLKWQFGPGGANAFFSSSPAIGKDETIYIGCANSNLYAIKPDGTGKWTNNLGGAIFSSPAIATNGTIYVGTLNNKVCALNPDGTPKWSAPFSAGGTVYSSPAIGTNGTIYFGGMDGYLYAITNNSTGTTGLLAWSTNLGGTVFSSPALDRYGSIFVGSDNGKVYAFYADGTKRWESANTGAAVRSSPTVGYGSIYCANQNGDLYALGPDGTTRWVFATGSSSQGSPVSGWDWAVFLGASNGNFYAFSPGGSNIWVQTNLGVIVSSPVLGENGMLYFGSVNSNVYALHVPTEMNRSAWPCFRGNLRHTGNAASLLLKPVGFTSSNTVFEISGPNLILTIYALYWETNVIESSTDLTNWTTIGTNSSVDYEGTGLFTNACSNCFYRVKSVDGTVLSFNALGHLNVYAPTGYSMIANQLNNPGGNAVATVLSSVPTETYVLKWNETTQAYITNRFSFGSWTDPNMTLNPGEGVFFWNPTNVTITLTFVGEVPQGYLLNGFPTNYSIRSSIVAQSGGLLSALGFPPVEFDNILRYNNATSSYDVYTYLFGSWSPSEPQPAVGESFFINTGSARNWTRTFSVWP